MWELGSRRVVHGAFAFCFSITSHLTVLRGLIRANCPFLHYSFPVKFLFFPAGVLDEAAHCDVSRQENRK